MPNTAKTWLGRVEVNAPPHTRAKIGEGYPSERQSDTPTRRWTETSPKSSPQATFWHEPKNEPTATKRHDTRPHTPPQGQRGQTSDRSDDERTPRDHFTSQKPPTAAADIRTPEDGKRTTPERRKTASGHHQTAGERREGDTPTPRARAHTSRTAADMHARERYACSYVAILYILLYFILYASSYILFVFYIIAFSSCCLYCFSFRFSACALCARVILPRLCIFMQYLCIFIYKVSIYRYFIQFLFIMRFLCKAATSYYLYYIYIMRDTLTPWLFMQNCVYLYICKKIWKK